MFEKNVLHLSLTTFFSKLKIIQARKINLASPILNPVYVINCLGTMRKYLLFEEITSQFIFSDEYIQENG